MTRASVFLLCVWFAAGTLASANDVHYYPPVSGVPVGSVAGLLTDIGFGNGSGGLTIQTDEGKVVTIYAARRPFKIDGKTIECPQPPKRRFKPSREDCPQWPSRVVIGRTKVRVPYWRGERYGRPTLVTNGFKTVAN